MGNLKQISVYERTREVYKFMNEVSKRNKEVVHFFSKKWTEDGYFERGISDLSKARTIANYIKRVKQTYLNYETEIETEKGRTLARLDDLYQKLIKVQDYKGALGILREIGDIVGFRAPTKTDLTSKGEKITLTITPEDAKL